MQEFYGAAAGRSWLTLVKQSSHTEFLNAGPILNKAIAAFCGAVGGNSYQVIFQIELLYITLHFITFGFFQLFS